MKNKDRKEEMFERKHINESYIGNFGNEFEKASAVCLQTQTCIKDTYW